MTIKALLDKYEYLAHKDGEIYTPRDGFEFKYQLLVTDPEAYFKEVGAAIDQDATNSERGIYDSAGGAHNGAMAVVQSHLDSLEGGTVKLIEEEEE